MTVTLKLTVKLAEVYTYLLSVAKMTVNKKTLEIIRLSNHFIIYLLFILLEEVWENVQLRAHNLV